MTRQREGAVAKYTTSTADEIVVICILNYIMEKAEITNFTNFAVIRNDNLAILLAARCLDVRMHGYKVFDYVDTAGVWKMGDDLEFENKRHLFAAEGALIDLYEMLKDDENALVWNWAAIEPALLQLIEDRRTNYGDAIQYFMSVAKRSGDHVRRSTSNKVWKAYWMQRMADMVSHIIEYFDQFCAKKYMTKLFLATRRTPMPEIVGSRSWIRTSITKGWRNPRHRRTIVMSRSFTSAMLRKPTSPRTVGPYRSTTMSLICGTGQRISITGHGSL